MGAAARTIQLLLSLNGVRALCMVHAKQRPQPPPFIRTSKKHSQRNKYWRRCPTERAAYRCHHCGVGCECACWANCTGLEKKRGCEVCLPRTSSGLGHSFPSKNCVFDNMLPGLLQLRSDRFTKSALSRPSPAPLPPLRLLAGAALPCSLPRLPLAPAVDPLARLTTPPAPF